MHFSFVVILCFLGQLAVSEPQCSKFHYDEAMLEKMVRMEHKFELVQSEFTDLRQDMKYAVKQIADLQTMIKEERNGMKTQIANQLDEVQEERQDLRKNFADLNETISTKVSDLLKETQNVLNHKEKQINRMSSDLQNVYRDLHTNLSESIATPIVGFKATGLKNLKPSNGEVLVFPTVMFNTGGKYNVDDGVFTAPVSGLYIFTVQLCIESKGYVTARLMIDQDEVGRILEQESTNYYPCNTADAIANMVIGGKAFVKLYTRSTALDTDGHRLLSFSGALLNKV